MSVENFPPHIVSAIARQIKQLALSPPDGVSFVPAEASLTEIFADIEGPVQTPYEGGVFRVKLSLTREYPSAPPKACGTRDNGHILDAMMRAGHFITKIFHPNVSVTGDICVNTLKKDWTPETTLSHVLAVIRCLLIVPFPESSLNDDAGKMFMESYDEYHRKAKLMTSIHAMPGRAEAGAAPPAAAATAGHGGASSSVGVAACSSVAVAAAGADDDVARPDEATLARSSSSTTLTEMTCPTKSANAGSVAAEVTAGEKKKLDGAGAADKAAADVKKKKTLKRL